MSLPRQTDDMIAIPPSKPSRRPRLDYWVVAVNRRIPSPSGRQFLARVIYACVPSRESADILHGCALKLGYKDATVERMDDYIRIHGSKSAKEYLAALEGDEVEGKSKPSWPIAMPTEDIIGRIHPAGRAYPR
jgi:hypothetical protein